MNNYEPPRIIPNVDVAEIDRTVRAFIKNGAVPASKVSCTLVCRHVVATATTVLAANGITPHPCERSNPAIVRRPAPGNRGIVRTKNVQIA